MKLMPEKLAELDALRRPPMEPDLQAAIERVRAAFRGGYQEDLAALAVVLTAAERVPALEARAELSDKLTATEPDPEVAAAAATWEALFDEMSCCPVRDDEVAALNLLVNRASGITVARLQEELRSWEATQ